ncbi:MAG: hypothetical protein AAF725_03795 [Acidobacteriota bacterium]
MIGVGGQNQAASNARSARADPSKARGKLERAREDFEALEVPYWIEQAQAELDGAGAE